MIYTQQRRRSMNKAVRELHPEIEFYERPGISVMECNTLPKGAVQIVDSESFLRKIRGYCQKVNDMGTVITDYSKLFPVFIRSMELCGKNCAEVRHYYRVNYVSTTEASQQRATEYIAEGKLYAVL